MKDELKNACKQLFLNCGHKTLQISAGTATGSMCSLSWGVPL